MAHNVLQTAEADAGVVCHKDNQHLHVLSQKELRRLAGSAILQGLEMVR